MNRREFTKNIAAGTLGAVAIPQFAIGSSGPSANSRINVALIGSGNIGTQAYRGTLGENWVAICDADEGLGREGMAKHEASQNTPFFTDFRKMFDKMADQIDAVCVSTPDHTHFAATMWALEHGKHVITQKPLTHTIAQSRALRKAAEEKGVVTNMANQGHTYNGIRQIREWLEADLIGDVYEVHSVEGGPNWESKYFHKPEEYPLSPAYKPFYIDWQSWIGPAKEIVYNPALHPLTWRNFWDYGTGMLGDWFCHTCDGAVWTLDLYEPEYVELITKGGDNGEAIIPDRSIVKWHFPARGNKAPCDLYWYDGGMRPGNEPVDKWGWGRLPIRGSYFYGEKNTLFLDERSNNPKLISREDMIDFRNSGYPAEKYPRVPQDLQQPFKEWVAAIKGDQATPGSEFGYASKLTEVALLGVLAQRFGGRIEWDARNMKITNRPELNQYLQDNPRKGWEVGAKYLA